MSGWLPFTQDWVSRHIISDPQTKEIRGEVFSPSSALSDPENGKASHHRNTLEPNQKEGLPVVIIIHGGGLLNISKHSALHGARHCARKLAQTGSFVGVVLHYPTTALPARVMGLLLLILGFFLSLGCGGIFGFESQIAFSFFAYYSVFCAIFVSLYRIFVSFNKTTKHPEHVQSAADAIELIQREIERFGGNPNALVLCGHSAGGFICAHLCFNPSLWFGNSFPANAIRGCILLSAVGDLLPLFQYRTFVFSLFVKWALLIRQSLKPEHSPILHTSVPSISYLILSSETEFFQIPPVNALAERVLGTSMWVDVLSRFGDVQNLFTGVVEGTNHFNSIYKAANLLANHQTFWNSVQFKGRREK